MNPKDHTDNKKKSELHEISCKDCGQKYVGQSGCFIQMIF